MTRRKARAAKSARVDQVTAEMGRHLDEIDHLARQIRAQLEAVDRDN